MKAITAFGCLIILCSCHKSDENSSLPKLNGKWELRKIEYGYSTEPEILLTPDNGNTISFSGNNQYSRTDIAGGDMTTASGTYRITDAITCGSIGVTTIDFSNPSLNNGSIVTLSGDSLYFKSDSCVIADGTERTYVRTN